MARRILLFTLIVVGALLAIRSPVEHVESASVFDGLYAIITPSGGGYRSLPAGGSSWDTISGTAGGSATALKSRGNVLVYKEGHNNGQAFRVSKDRGESWVTVSAPSGNHRPVGADICANGRIWFAWSDDDTGGTSTYHRVQLRYSDDDGETNLLSKDISIAEFGAAGHANGDLTCNARDTNRVAAVVGQSSSSKVFVTTDGGKNWQVYGSTPTTPPTASPASPLPARAQSATGGTTMAT
jgi:hypothetical protein